MSAPGIPVPGPHTLSLRALRGGSPEPTLPEWESLLAGQWPENDPWTGLDDLIALAQALAPHLRGRRTMQGALRAALQESPPPTLSPLLRRLRGGLRGYLSMGLPALEQPQPEPEDWLPVKLNTILATDTRLQALRLLLRAPEARWFQSRAEVLANLSTAINSDLSGIPEDAWSEWHAAFRPHLPDLLTCGERHALTVAARFAGRPIHLKVQPLSPKCSEWQRVNAVLNATSQLQNHWRPVAARPGHHPLDAAVRQMGIAPVISRRSRHALNTSKEHPDHYLIKSQLRSLNLLLAWLRQPLPELDESHLQIWQQVAGHFAGEASPLMEHLSGHGSWRQTQKQTWAAQIKKALRGQTIPTGTGR